MVLWLIIAFICILMELFIPGMFFALSLGIGASVSAIVSWFIGLHGQIIAGMIGTFIGYRLLRNYVEHVQRIPPSPTNMERLKGQRVKVLTAIEGGIPGTVKLDGSTWNVIERENNDIAVGTCVEIIGVRGCHLIVKKIN